MCNNSWRHRRKTYLVNASMDETKAANSYKCKIFRVVFYFCPFCSYNIFAYASVGKRLSLNIIFVVLSAAIYCNLTTIALNIRPTSSFFCVFILTLYFPNTETKIEWMVFSWIKLWAVMGLICINMSRDRWVRKTVIYLRIVFPDL